MLDKFGDWLDNQSIAVESIIIIAMIIISFTVIVLIFHAILKICRKNYIKRQQNESEKQEKLIQEHQDATKEKYLNAAVTDKIVRLIQNDNELTKVNLSFYHITLYYHEKEETIYFYEWDFDSVPAEDFNRGFADAVMERLGNNYSYEPSMNDTSGVITVVKGE